MSRTSDMRDDDSVITGVADTALWVAALRAREAERSNPALRDHLASMLAGERGRKIARSMPHSAMVAWAVVMRASAIDRLIHEAIRAGADTVINLGAGLDTRPYRMQLPADMRWVEVDLPAIIELKNAKLRDCTPVCEIERVGLNLLDVSARNSLLARYAASSRNVLVITEGLLPYFSNEDAGALARDLFALPSVHLWIQDFDNAGKRGMPRRWIKRLRAAPFLFRVGNWFAFFQEYGWRPCKIITSLEESEKLKRPYPFSFPLGLLMYSLPGEVRRKVLSVTGATLLQKL